MYQATLFIIKEIMIFDSASRQYSLLSILLLYVLLLYRKTLQAYTRFDVKSGKWEIWWKVVCWRRPIWKHLLKANVHWVVSKPSRLFPLSILCFCKIVNSQNIFVYSTCLYIVKPALKLIKNKDSSIGSLVSWLFKGFCNIKVKCKNIRNKI